MADLELGLSVTGVEQSVAGLNSVAGAVQRVTTNSVQSVAGQTSAAGAAQSVGQRARTAGDNIASMAQQMGDATGMVQRLAGAMGNQSLARGASLAGSLVNIVTQATAASAVMGPAGALGIAVTGLIPLVVQAAEALGSADGGLAHSFDAASSAASAFAGNAQAQGGFLDVIDRIVASTRRATDQASRMQRILSGQGTQEETAAAAEEAQHQVTRAGLDRQRARDALERAQSGVDRAGVWVDSTQRANLAAAQNELNRAETAYADAAGAYARIAQVAAGVAEQTDFNQPQATGISTARTRPQRRRAAPQSTGPDNSALEVGHIDRMFAESEAADQELIALAEHTAAEQERIRREERAKQIEHNRELAEAQRHRLEQQAEALRTYQEAERAWSSNSARNIDDVISAWRELERVAGRTGQQVPRSGQLMSRGMAAVGNQIADTVGNKMTGAFESALGAWLDGSKSFVEAAEGMAKGVLKALTMEAIVQAVTETARGIADLASYHYDSAALHFGAAAAWGAVGVAAGSVGAAVGAFSGGSKGVAAKGNGSDPRDLSARSVRNDREAGTQIVNVYPGFPISTDRDIASALYRALNMGAQRDGMRLRSEAVRGT